MPVVPEVVPYAEGVAYFMGHRAPVVVCPHQGSAGLFRAPVRRAEIPSVDSVVAVVNHNDDNALGQIEIPCDLVERIPRIVDVVAIGMLPIHTVNHRISLAVRLDAEGLVPVPVSLHLLAEPGLNVEDILLHPLHHLRAKGTVAGQEVEQPYGAGLAGVQIRQPLAGGMDDGRILIGLEEEAGVQAVGGGRGGVADGRGREQESKYQFLHPRDPLRFCNLYGSSVNSCLCPLRLSIAGTRIATSSPCQGIPPVSNITCRRKLLLSYAIRFFLSPGPSRSHPRHAASPFSPWDLPPAGRSAPSLPDS